VFCYFDHDVKVHAPYDAARLGLVTDSPPASECQRRWSTITVVRKSD